jgi:hypothetical protein
MPPSHRDRDVLHHIETRLSEDDPDFVVLFDLIERTSCFAATPTPSQARGEGTPKGSAVSNRCLALLFWNPRSLVVAAMVTLTASGLLCVLAERAARADDLTGLVMLMPCFPAALVPLARFLRSTGSPSPPNDEV